MLDRPSRGSTCSCSCEPPSRWTASGEAKRAQKVCGAPGGFLLVSQKFLQKGFPHLRWTQTFKWSRWFQKMWQSQQFLVALETRCQPTSESPCWMLQAYDLDALLCFGIKAWCCKPPKPRAVPMAEDELFLLIEKAGKLNPFGSLQTLQTYRQTWRVDINHATDVHRVPD